MAAGCCLCAGHAIRHCPCIPAGGDARIPVVGGDRFPPPPPKSCGNYTYWKWDGPPSRPPTGLGQGTAAAPPPQSQGAVRGAGKVCCSRMAGPSPADVAVKIRRRQMGRNAAGQKDKSAWAAADLGRRSVRRYVHRAKGDPPVPDIAGRHRISWRNGISRRDLPLPRAAAAQGMAPPQAARRRAAAARHARTLHADTSMALVRVRRK